VSAWVYLAGVCLTPECRPIVMISRSGDAGRRRRWHVGDVSQSMVLSVLRDRLVPYVIAAAGVFAVLLAGWGVTTGAWSPTWDVWLPLGLFGAGHTAPGRHARRRRLICRASSNVRGTGGAIDCG